MFRLESQENPLAMLIGAAGNTYFQNQLQQQKETKEAQQLEKGLAGLNNESSPMDWFRAINRLPENMRDNALKFYDIVSNKENAVQKRAAETEKEIRTKQDKATEAAAKEEKEAEESAILGKLARGEKITPDEEKKLSPASQRSRLTASEKRLEKNEQETLKANEQISHAKGDLQQIKKGRELARATSGIGAAKLLNPLGSAEASELESIGFGLIESFMPTLNPRGTKSIE